MFGKYDKKTFNEIKSQHNIMVLVGNGFDIALLNKYKTGKMKSIHLQAKKLLESS